LKYNFSINDGEIKIEWMKDGKLNLCYNCLDRHAEKRGSQVKQVFSHCDGGLWSAMEYRNAKSVICRKIVAAAAKSCQL
jgi:acetyl-CoA synthetase